MLHQVGGKEVEWTLGFVLAEVETDTTETESNGAHIDSSMLGELPHTTSEPTPESARNTADCVSHTTAVPTSATVEKVLEGPSAQQTAPRGPAISAEDALRYVELVNDVIAKVETTVGDLVAQAKSVKAQCESMLQRFVRF